MIIGSMECHHSYLQDMVDSQVPDKFSIITYVSQFYHLLKVRIRMMTRRMITVRIVMRIQESWWSDEWKVIRRLVIMMVKLLTEY